MIKKLLASSSILAFTAVAAHAAAAVGQGIVTVRSTHSVPQTVARIEQLLKKKHLQLVAVVNHSAAAKKAGLSLRPTELVIFGNPLLGTKMMDMNQSAGLDLPLKVLVWENAAGQTLIGYNNPAYLAHRYGISPSALIIKKMTAAMRGLTAKAAGS